MEQEVAGYVHLGWMDTEPHDRRNDAMADTDAVARPTTAPLATLATITVYERLVSEKDAEIASLRAEIEQLTRQLASQQTRLRQAQALIAHLSERVAEERGAAPRVPAAA